MLLLHAIWKSFAGTVGAACFLAPMVSAQIVTEPMRLPEDIIATGDTSEVRALTAWAEEHRHTNPDQARQVAERALVLAQALNDQRGIGETSILLGNLAMASDLNLAETHYMMAQEAFEQIHPERGLYRTMINLGVVYERREDMRQALALYFAALDGFERLGDIEGQARALSNIGKIYRNQGNREDAMLHSQRAVVLAETLGDPALLVHVLISYGNIFMVDHAYQNAELIMRRALAISEERGFKLHAATIYSSLGYLFNAQEHYEQALSFLLIGERLSSELEEAALLGSVYEELAKAYLGLGNYNSALEYANESLVLAQEVGSVFYQMEAYRTLSQIYEATGNDRQALIHYRNHAAAKDLVFNTERTEILADMQTRYETEEQRRANERLAQQNRIQTLQLTLLLVSVGSLLLILGFLYYRYRVKQKANRLLEELDAAKSRFFANISHEFRTPLTVILGSMQDALLGRFGKTTDLLTEQHQVVLRNTRQLQRLINEVLDLNRLESGRLELRPVPGDLVLSLKYIIEANAPLAERNGITLTLACDVDSCPRLYDEEKLEKIVGNLLSNALKFTPRDGSVVVNLHCNDDVEISVTDDGPGIPSEDQSNVFNRFTQLDQGVLKGGTGIGLALAKELTELHGGTLTLDSVPGEGSTFTVRLSLDKVALSDLRDTSADLVSLPELTVGGDGYGVSGISASDNKSSKQADRTTVLIIEDNDDVRAYVRRSLEEHYRILEATDGEIGLQRALDELPDLIVSDVMLPGIDGYEVVQRLKAEPATECIPAVILTARAGEDDQVQGYGSGAEVYITKPFSSEVLRAACARSLEERQRLRKRLQEHAKQDGKEVASNVQSTLVDRARAVVLENLYDEKFGIDELASALHMARRTLYHNFESEVGVSPGNFVRSVRLERARELLSAGAGSVSEVAYAVGFNSLVAFSRAYRTHHGIPPSAHLIREINASG